MGSLNSRLRRLEARETNPLAEFADWDPTDQLEAAADYVNFHRRFGSVAVCTDREITLLGIIAAYNELGGTVGEWVALESGTVITLMDAGPEGLFNVSFSGNILVEDLPEHTRPYVERMSPGMQERRERWLFEHREEHRLEREERPERLKREEAERRRRSEESRKRDRELIERNRAACGLPPLDTEDKHKKGM